MKKFRIYTVLLTLFLLGFSITRVYANIDMPAVLTKSLLFRAIYIYLIIITIVLFSSLLLLEMIKKDTWIRCLIYVAVSYISGFLLNIAGYYLARLVWGHFAFPLVGYFGEYFLQPCIIFAVVCGFILFVGNGLIGRLTLKQEPVKCIILAIIVSIFTNPVIGYGLGYRIFEYTKIAFDPIFRTVML